ncbi:MAG TPA: hypothetical protein VFG65_02335 [Fimbriimonadales bacterium]|nr:hypothetical protein [Fimbriimonadales bacterium]
MFSGGGSIRAYFWHQNASSLPVNVALVAGGVSQIRNYRSQRVSNGGGICLADAQLYGSYDYLGTVPVGADDIILPNSMATLQFGQTAGFAAEFDVGLTLETLLLRTVAWTGTAGGAPGTFWGPLAAMDGSHPRGSWGFSNCLLSGGSFDVAPGVGSDTRQISCCAHGGAEEGSFPAPPFFPPDPSSADEGLFGVNLTYRFQVTNSSDAPHELFVYLAAQNTPSDYFGAAKILSPGTNPDKGVPPLRHGEQNFVDLTTAAAQTIPPDPPVTVDVTVANGGGATMPFLIILSKLNLRTNP